MDILVVLRYWLTPLLLLLSIIVCSGNATHRTFGYQGTTLPDMILISTNQKDITTPITTVPTATNTPTISSTTTSPVYNPTKNTDSPAAATNPTTVPFSTTSSSPSLPGSSWCIASPSSNQKALQTALDYACGYGGADCSQIQPGGSCYYPNTVKDHASYAFNLYYQKNPVPNSCNFGGTGIITSTNPSSGSCAYPSTSTSSSVLDTSNQNSSTIFGVGPNGPSSSATASFHMFCSYLFCALVSLILMLRYDSS